MFGWMRHKEVPATTAESEDVTIVERLEVGAKEPFKARVTRLEPKEFNNVRVEGDFPGGHVTGLKSLSEMRDTIRRVAGGGRFQAKIYEDKVGGRPITQTNFTIPGEPMLNSKPIPSEDGEQAQAKAKKKKDDDESSEPEEVIDLKRQEAIEEARHRAELARRRREEEIQGRDGPPDDSSSAALLAKLAEMEAKSEQVRLETSERIAQQAREFEERMAQQAREYENRESQRKRDSEIAELRNQIVQLMAQVASGGGNNQTGDMIRLLSQKSDENLKMLVQIMTKSSDDKLALAATQTDLLARTFNAGLAAAQGRTMDDDEEEAPKDLAGVVNANVGKVIDLAGQYFMQRQESPKGKTPPTPEEIAAISRRISAQIRAESAASANQLARVNPQPAAQQAQQGAQQNQQQAPQQRQRTADVGALMNKFLRKIIRDARSGKATPDSFVADAQTYLPKQVLEELLLALNTGGADALVAVLKKYGDPRLVDEAYAASQAADQKLESEEKLENEEKQPEVAGQPDAPVVSEE